jgi:hypothetical protein
VLGSGRLGRVGTAIVFVAVIVVAVAFALVDSVILCYTVVELCTSRIYTGRCR